LKILHQAKMAQFRLTPFPLAAAIPGLSADRRFAIAYNALLELSKMAAACAG
jgi:hypothetical protein